MSLHCYNKGCGLMYNENDNIENACHFHPGQPVFHDAYKSWSCCKKKSIDFTEFLNLEGCTTGPHSNVKIPEPVKQQIEVDCPDKVMSLGLVSVIRNPVPSPGLVRPSLDEPMQPLKVVVADSLRTQLEKLIIEQQEPVSIVTKVKEVLIGTQCKNNACKSTYNGAEGDNDVCMYHLGVPVFHEGMKYWSCCNRKTSDFNNFLDQEGCTSGKHVWIKSQDQHSAECKVDWHQTTSAVCVSIFARSANPERSLFEVNQVALKVFVVHGKSGSVFQKTFNLWNIIVPEKCHVVMFGTKIEINLKKAECFRWSDFEMSVESTKSISKDRQ